MSERDLIRTIKALTKTSEHMQLRRGWLINAIKDGLIEARITQSVLAKYLKLSEPYVSHLLQGKREGPESDKRLIEFGNFIVKRIRASRNVVKAKQRRKR